MNEAEQNPQAEEQAAHLLMQAVNDLTRCKAMLTAGEIPMYGYAWQCLRDAQRCIQALAKSQEPNLNLAFFE